MTIFKDYKFVPFYQGIQDAKVVGPLFLEDAIKNNKTAYSFDVEGEANSSELDEKLNQLSQLSQLNGRLTLQYNYQEDHEFRIYTFNNENESLLYVSRNKNDDNDNVHYKASLFSKDKEFSNSLFEFFKSILKKTEIEHGRIFSFISRNNQLGIEAIGFTGIPFDNENYSKETIEAYNYIISDIKSNSPSGRIAIIDGEPGTGKTHLVRSIINETKDAMFILVPTSILNQMSGPSILPILLSTKDNYNINGPIVLILEDADDCLVRRSSDNMSLIQSLLNLGDGILGSLLDLRIIVTTNAKKIDFEPAILRAGRLSRKITVSLSRDEVLNVYKRLVPNKHLDDSTEFFKMKNPTLAEAYLQARKDGWAPETKDKKKSKSNRNLVETNSQF